MVAFVTTVLLVESDLAPTVPKSHGTKLQDLDLDYESSKAQECCPLVGCFGPVTGKQQHIVRVRSLKPGI